MKILACVDGSIYASSVTEHAAYAAWRLGASVELLQVVGRRDVGAADRASRAAPGARRELLQEIAELDAHRFRLAMNEAALSLDEATQALREAGVQDVKASVREGDLLEEIAARGKDAEMIIVGKRGEAADFAKLHLGSNLERILRSATRPVFVASRAFSPIRHVVIAYDDRASMRKAVDALSRSPLFATCRLTVLVIGEATDQAHDLAEKAAAQLRAGGLVALPSVAPGSAAEVIPAQIAELGADALVMGAYGHSRLRALMIGSTTSSVIRDSRTPVLVYR